MRKAKCTTEHIFDSKITGLVICNVEARGRQEERVTRGGGGGDVNATGMLLDKLELNP